MNLLLHIAGLVINTPLMVTPTKLATIVSLLDGRIGIDALSTGIPAPQGSRYVGEFEPIDQNNPKAGRKPYRTTADGTAVVAIIGTLVNRGSYLDALSGITSYEKLKRDVALAAADQDVHTIVLDIDSPGGEATGAFEAADGVAVAAKLKPVVAVANGLCCSAAFAIASAATRIIASPSSVIGSVGVVLLHVDHSQQLNRAGLKPTLIHAGARKVDGSPYVPLTDEVTLELQSYVERVMDLFVAGVARGRPGLTEAAIRATEARVYLGADAVAVGFADAVGTFEDIVTELARTHPVRAALPAPRGGARAERWIRPL